MLCGRLCSPRREDQVRGLGPFGERICGEEKRGWRELRWEALSIFFWFFSQESDWGLFGRGAYGLDPGGSEKKR